jgi:arylsulfatase
MDDPPNIVMVSWDSVRADHLPFHGYGRDTAPFVTSKATGPAGTVFQDAYVSAVGTPASFTGIFTGEHASGNQLDPSPGHWRRANEGRTMLSERLRDEGYYTGAFHFNALMSSHFGWDRGWNEYHDGMWDKSQGDGDDGGLKKRVYDALQERDMANFAVHLKKTVTGEEPESWEALWPGVERFVEEAPEPWFLWVLLIDTHHPYLPPEGRRRWPQYGTRATYASNYVMRRHRGLVGVRRRPIVNAYDNTIRYADEFTRRLHEKLEEEGHGSAPFIVHSDHGDELGEHANYGHRPLMYDTVTRVPLVGWNLGLAGEVPGPNSLLDLGNTVLRIAGADADLGEGGVLVGANTRDVATVRNNLGDHGVAAAAVDGHWKLLHHPEGDWGHGGHIEPGRQAYTRHDRRDERDMLGDHPGHLEPALERLLARGGDEAATGGGATGDVSERLAELGYLE